MVQFLTFDLNRAVGKDKCLCAEEKMHALSWTIMAEYFYYITMD